MTATSIARWYAPVYVACIAGLSLQTMASARGMTDHHFWLAAIEILAVLGLLWRPARRAALVLLLLVYLFAAFITLHLGHLPIYLALYAASAVCVVQLTEAAGRTEATAQV